MRKGLIDDQTIDFTCDCGVVTSKSVGWLKKNDEFVCTCGTLIKLHTGDFLRKMSKIDISFDDLKATIDRINKRK